MPPLDLIVSIDWLGGGNVRIHVRIGNDTPANEVPFNPTVTSDITQGDPNIAYMFETITSDPESDELYYQWDWGDGRVSDWLGPYASGENCSTSHTWTSLDSYEVKTRAKDYWSGVSDWSAPWLVTIGCCIGVRGNIDSDLSDQIDIADLVYFVNYSFGNPPGPEPACFKEADVDATDGLDIGDIVYLVNYMFGSPSGPAPLDCL